MDVFNLSRCKLVLFKALEELIFFPLVFFDLFNYLLFFLREVCLIFLFTFFFALKFYILLTQNDHLIILWFLSICFQNYDLIRWFLIKRLLQKSSRFLCRNLSSCRQIRFGFRNTYKVHRLISKELIRGHRVKTYVLIISVLSF